MNSLPMKKAQQGFTLIELMIVVAIIGILASIALPAYTNYTNKARFTEVVMAATAPKTGVELCGQTTGALTACGGGSNGVPVDIGTTTTGNIRSVATASTGEITITPNAQGNITTSHTYILTPTLTNGKVTWAVNPSSGCLAASLCQP